jgi:thiamine biosynthesis lipoprotein
MPAACAEWSVWSTTARVAVTDGRSLDAARQVVEVVLADVERAASRFRPDAEIRHLRPGPDGEVRLSPTLARLMRYALRAAEVSGGRLDPTVGASLRALGYDRDIRLVVRDGAPTRAVVRVVHGWRRLELHGESLRFPPGLELDLGATAKAVAADDAALVIAARLGTGALVSLGGDIGTAGPAPDGGWQVLVQDRPGDPRSRIALAPGTALATSSTQGRRWRQGDRFVHHIVDPATGQPAAGPRRCVSVVARSCFEANVASTTTIVRGDDGLRWLSGLHLPARLVRRDGRVVTVGGWPADPVDKDVA